MIKATVKRPIVIGDKHYSTDTEITMSKNLAKAYEELNYIEILEETTPKTPKKVARKGV